nr:uncharacterized protein CTRU02_02707 [Colletotrichum truncatum]KAF6797665.1 hypothetical protein CTRU02_02707 [Colletotrichum truncatum]
MLPQDVLGPLREVFDHNAFELRVVDDVSWQISTNKGDDLGDFRVGKALNKGLAANHPTGSYNENFHNGDDTAPTRR